MEYRRDIDGLRALAVAPVVCFHAGYEVAAGGFLGVDIFFVISGYLITALIYGEYREGRFSLLTFYERRARRILPALFFVMATTFAVGWFLLLPVEFVELSYAALAVIFFLSNLFFLNASAADENGYFAAETQIEPLLHTWSLAVEEQFYLVFPLLFLFWPRTRTTALQILLGVLALASLLLCEWLLRHHPAAAFYLAPSRAFELLAGALVALNVERMERIRYQQSLAWAGALLVGYALTTFDAETPLPGVATLVPVLGTVLLLAFAKADRGVGKLLAAPPLVAIGLISYSWYLWHHPVLTFGNLLTNTPNHLHTLFLIALSLAMAWLSWRWVERPFRDRTRFGRAQIFKASAASAACLTIVSLFLLGRQGLPARLPEHLNTALAGQGEHMLAFECRNQNLTDYPAPCRLGDPQASPAYAIWGDSYAGALTRALGDRLAERKLGGRSLVHFSCPGIVGTFRYEPERLGAGFSRACASYVETSFEALLSDPGIETVIMVNSYEWYLQLDAQRPEPILVTQPEPPVDQDESQRRENVMRAIAQTANRLAASGKSVVLVSNHPRLPGFERRNLVREAWLQHDGRLHATAEISAYQAGIAQLNELRAPLTWHHRVRWVDGGALFCEQFCALANEEGLMVFDGAHLTYAGARRVVDLILQP
ncbi:MAG: acyltransferase family protein [Pseudomonadota bacterium]